MPRVPQKKQYTEKQNRCIYAILNSQTKEFFVGYTLNGKENLRCAFKGHRTEKRRATKDMIRRAKEQDIRPCFFKLDELYCTKVEAYHAVIGWTKIFVEQGYINVDHGNIECYIEDIFGEAEEYYESKKQINIDQDFCCSNCLSQCNGKSKKEPKAKGGKVQVKLIVTEQEKLQIQKNARAAGRSVSAYIRGMALNLCIFKLNYREIDDHTHEISSLRNAINQLIYTIVKTGDYYPSELEAIHELMVKIIDSEKNFLQMMDKDWRQKEKLFKKQVENVINQRLKTSDKTNTK